MAPVPACQLQRGLVGLGTRVAEEHLAAATDQPVERLCYVDSGLSAEQVRHVQQGDGLSGEGLGHRGVGVAEADNAEAAQDNGASTTHRGHEVWQ